VASHVCRSGKQREKTNYTPESKLLVEQYIRFWLPFIARYMMENNADFSHGLAWIRELIGQHHSLCRLGSRNVQILDLSDVPSIRSLLTSRDCSLYGAVNNLCRDALVHSFLTAFSIAFSAFFLAFLCAMNLSVLRFSVWHWLASLLKAKTADRAGVQELLRQTYETGLKSRIFARSRFARALMFQ
jgi:hypothetical protein